MSALAPRALAILICAGILILPNPCTGDTYYNFVGSGAPTGTFGNLGGALGLEYGPFLLNCDYDTDISGSNIQICETAGNTSGDGYFCMYYKSIFCDVPTFSNGGKRATFSCWHHSPVTQYWYMSSSTIENYHCSANGPIPPHLATHPVGCYIDPTVSPKYIDAGGGGGYHQIYANANMARTEYYETMGYDFYGPLGWGTLCTTNDGSFTAKVVCNYQVPLSDSTHAGLYITDASDVDKTSQFHCGDGYFLAGNPQFVAFDCNVTAPTASYKWYCRIWDRNHCSPWTFVNWITVDPSCGASSSSSSSSSSSAGSFTCSMSCPGASATVSWSAVPGATAYSLYAPHPGSNPCPAFGGTSCTFATTPGNTYAVSIFDTNNGVVWNRHDCGNMVCGNPPFSCTSMNCPSPGTSATVAWSARPGSTSYSLYSPNTAGTNYCPAQASTSCTFATTAGNTYPIVVQDTFDGVTWYPHSCGNMTCASSSSSSSAPGCGAGSICGQVTTQESGGATGIPTYPLALYNEGQQLISRIATASDGSYVFSGGLTAGSTYYVRPNLDANEAPIPPQYVRQTNASPANFQIRNVAAVFNISGPPSAKVLISTAAYSGNIVMRPSDKNSPTAVQETLDAGGKLTVRMAGGSPYWFTCWIPQISSFNVVTYPKTVNQLINSGTAVNPATTVNLQCPSALAP